MLGQCIYRRRLTPSPARGLNAKRVLGLLIPSPLSGVKFNRDPRFTMGLHSIDGSRGNEVELDDWTHGDTPEGGSEVVGEEEELAAVGSSLRLRHFPLKR